MTMEPEVPHVPAVKLVGTEKVELTAPAWPGSKETGKEIDAPGARGSCWEATNATPNAGFKSGLEGTKVTAVLP
jgi:hypothetical protein